MSRARRAWTPQEDQLLRDAVAKEDPGNPNPSKWHAIAQHVPDRTNKDCRKRWFAKMASDTIVKGGWSPEEDEKLLKAIELHGTKWSIVAQVVQTRNSDQCAKRWTDTLNPSIDRSHWSSEADATLIRAVNEHGKVWTKIVKTYFPGRTGLAAKNRYNSITRAHADGSGTRRRASAVPVNSTSTSSASSSVSPHTPMNELPPLNPGYGYQTSNYHHTLSATPPQQQPQQSPDGYRLMPMQYHDMQQHYPHPNSMSPQHQDILSRPYLPPPVNTSYRPPPTPMQMHYTHSGLHLDNMHPSHHHHHHPDAPLDAALLPPLRFSPSHSHSVSPINGIPGRSRSDSDRSDH